MLECPMSSLQRCEVTSGDQLFVRLLTGLVRRADPWRQATFRPLELGSGRTRPEDVARPATELILEVAFSLECGEDIAVPGRVRVAHRGLHGRLERGNDGVLHGHADVRAARAD